MAASEQKQNTASLVHAAGHNTAVAASIESYQYHPLFSSPEADIVLRSSDDVLYRVYSYTLRVTTGLFRTMFSLPQPQRAVSGPEGGECSSTTKGTDRAEIIGECIPVHETSEILTLFLMLLSGRPTNKPMSAWGDLSAGITSTGAATTGVGRRMSSYDVIERVLLLAENWDAPGPISYIRIGITSPELLTTDPLRLYVIATHFDWEAEKALASRYTLNLDLFGASCEENTIGGGDDGDPVDDYRASIEFTLERLSSRDLLSIIKLRHSRRERFRELINLSSRFTAGNSDEYICTQCGETALDNETWRTLKEALIVELDRRPLGDSIVGRAVGGIGTKKGLGLGVRSWPQAEQCWQAKCVKEDCEGLNYDRFATLMQIQSCVDELPWDIK